MSIPNSVPSDTIVGVDNATIGSSTQLNTAMSQYRPGDKVNVSWVDSSGQRHSANVTLVEGPPA